MARNLVRVALAALLALTGCAVRVASTPPDTIPATAPKSAPEKPPSPPIAPGVPAPGTGTAPPAEAPAAAAAHPTVPPSNPAEGQPPPATESAYVFSPQQAVSAPPSAAPSRAPSPAAPSPKRDDATADSPGALQLVVVAMAPEVATGELTTVDVMASASSEVVDAPLHLSFDPTVLEYVDGAPGDFLTQGGSSVVFLADGLSRPGDVAVAAGRVDRERGASGSGLLCRVHLRGLRAGTSPVFVGRAKAWGSRGEALNVVTAGTTVVVH